MICPNCQSSNLKKNGKSKTGKQEYQCKDCDRYFQNTSNPKGRPTIGERPLTNAERAYRYRQKKKDELRQP